ncbi:MAG: HDOD domain-containing protein [Bryobacteraceae bacterium]|nr:HDOD domain-containing protein [Bryobacteraceae bacterium]
MATAAVWGVEEHARAVRSVALELARRVGIAGDSLQVLEEAASHHHHPLDLGTGDALARLASEVVPGLAVLPGPAARPAAPAADLIHTLRKRSTGVHHDLLADLVELADLVVEHYEYCGLVNQPFDLGGIPLLAASAGFDPSLVEALEPSTGVLEFRHAARLVGVRPRLALRILSLGEDAGAREVSLIGEEDPIVAAHLIRAANSALYGTRFEVTNVPHAVNHLGVPVARQVILAVAMRPASASGRLLQEWRHAVTAAEFARTFGLHAGLASSEELFLAGLVHDIGRLVLYHLSAPLVSAYERLREQGCPPNLAETILTGMDHSRLGSFLLADWRFPEVLVEAVADHHAPSHPVASLLYVAEHAITGSPEGIISPPSLEDALDACGLSPQHLGEAAPSPLLEALAD